jgi:hypothetical protein
MSWEDVPDITAASAHRERKMNNETRNEKLPVGEEKTEQEGEEAGDDYEDVAEEEEVTADAQVAVDEVVGDDEYEDAPYDDATHGAYGDNESFVDGERVDGKRYREREEAAPLPANMDMDPLAAAPELAAYPAAAAHPAAIANP